MKLSRFIDAQMIGSLKDRETGISVTEMLYSLFACMDQNLTVEPYHRQPPGFGPNIENKIQQ
jgi:hypothetical protein